MPKFQERDILESPKFGIMLNGKEVGEDLLMFVEQITIDDEDDRLPMATINIADVESKWLNDAGIVKGTKVSVSLGHVRNYKRVFSGSITYIEASYPEEGFPSLILVCTDSASGLLKPRKSRSWKKRKISDIIKEMHKEANSKVIVEDTKIVLEHVIQEEGANMDFILEWKKRLGAKYYKVNTDTYYFGTKNRNVKATETLGYKTGGHEIMSFTPVYQEIEQEEVSEAELDENGKEIKSNAQLQPTYKALGSSPVGKAKPKSK